MTNFLIKYNSCVSKVARETDLEIKIAKKYTDIFPRGDASDYNYKIQVLFCLHKIAFQPM